MANEYGVSDVKGIKFAPLIFGGDYNVYSLARAFHEAYGTLSYVYGKFPSGPCMNSTIISYWPEVKADDPETFLRLVHQFAADKPDLKILLIGCGDNYVELASNAKPYLPENVITNYVEPEMIERLTRKENFYRMCDENGFDRPDTYIYHEGDDLDFTLPFGGPFVVKPSNSVEYWQCPFETQKKVYANVPTVEGVKSIIMDIYGAGYTDSVIIQNRIPGDDSKMRVLTTYSGKDGKVKMSCLGHVLLEEHTPHGLGNHAVIITEKNRELADKAAAFLNGIGYRGFANFDIKYDERDGKYKFFEINTRQGRSNYYVTGSGENLAKLLVRDLIDEEEIEPHYVEEENLWLVIPYKVAHKYVRDPKCLAEMERLMSEHKVDNPLFYGPDKTPAKNKYLVKNQLGQYYKYWKYYRNVK